MPLRLLLIESQYPVGIIHVGKGQIFYVAKADARIQGEDKRPSRFRILSLIGGAYKLLHLLHGQDVFLQRLLIGFANNVLTRILS